MQNYIDFPPENYLLRVLKRYPKSAFLYIQIWKKLGIKRCLLTVKKADIRKDFLVSKTMFRNLLIPLKLLELLDFSEDDTVFKLNVLCMHSDDI
jgi:hypothetical protein